MRVTRASLVCVAWLSVMFCASSVCARTLQRKVGLTDKDKAAVLRSVLEQRLQADSTSESRRAVNLSTENIDSRSVPKLRGIGFVLLTTDEIQKWADFTSDEIRKRAEGVFRYLKFDQFEVARSRIIVALSEVKIFGKRASGPSTSSRGTKYEFRKVKGNWTGKVTTMYGGVGGGGS